MTTLITDGQYFVADHRVTSKDDNPNYYNHQSNVRENPDSANTRVKEVVRDSSLKLVRIPENMLMMHKKEPIMVMASAGTNGAARNIVQQCRTIYQERTFELGDYLKLRSTFTKVAGHPRGFGLLGVTAKGCVLESPPADTPTITQHAPNGKVHAVGSGGTHVRALLKRINFRKSGLTLGDLVIWASFMDNHTSPSYSVMEIKSGIVYNTVTPGPEKNLETVRRILEMLANCGHKFPSFFNAV